jgi:hypothetical protein
VSAVVAVLESDTQDDRNKTLNVWDLGCGTGTPSFSAQLLAKDSTKFYSRRSLSSALPHSLPPLSLSPSVPHSLRE